VVSLRRAGDATVLAVTDDGSGFDAQKVRSRSLSSGDAEHYGLTSIAERCALIRASLRVDSVEGRGTAVIVELSG
jgi:two-component system, NarL family, sensor kinase